MKQKLGRAGRVVLHVLRILVFLTVCLAALAVLLFMAGVVADYAVHEEPVQRRATPSPAEYVTVAADERLFTLMAALNAAGYNEENNPDGMHPVRQAVRGELASKELTSLRRLRIQLRLAHPYSYVVWALQRSNPPAFARQAEGWWVSGSPAAVFFGLDDPLRQFYLEADIAALWQRSLGEYEAESARYRAAVGPAVQQMLAYLRVRNMPTDRIVVLPNLLDAYWRGYGPRIGSVSYVVVGPGETPNIGLVQHEAMHPIINPLVDANLKVIEKDRADQLYRAMRPHVGSGYQEWSTIVKECVIRAVGVRLLNPAEREQAIARHEEQGFLLVRPLAEKLAQFEQTTLSIAEYMPQLLASLNDAEL